MFRYWFYFIYWLLELVFFPFVTAFCVLCRCAGFSLTNYCSPTPFIYDIHSLVLKISVELSCFVCLP